MATEPGPATLEAGLKRHRAGHLAEAAAVYDAILDRAPDHRDALQLLAMLKVQAGDAAAGADLFARAARAAPELADTRANLAAARRLAGAVDAAVAAGRAAVVLDPAHLAAWLTLAHALKQLQRVGPAVASYRRALAVAPDHRAAAEGILALQRDWGPRLDAALTRASEAARRPGDAQTAIAAGRALLAIGDVGRAEVFARAALAAGGDAAAVGGILGRALLERCGITRVAAGRPFEVDAALAAEAVEALAGADGDGEAEWLHLAAVASLVQVGLASPDLLRRAAGVAWKRLGRHPKDSVAAAVIGHHVYRSGRLPLAGWLNGRFQKRFTPAEVVAEHELGLWRMLRTDERFFATLPPVEDMIAAMAPIEVTRDPEGGAAADEPFVLVSCDEVYFRRFAADLVTSLVDRMQGSTVVVHVVSPSAATRSDLARWAEDRRLDLGVSEEHPDTAGWTDIKRVTYYASARFLRARQWQRRLRRAMIVLDVDATVVGDLRALAPTMAGYDVGLMVDGRRRGPSREIAVGFVWYAETPAGHAYQDTVAAYIGRLLEGTEVYWMLDQMAHFAVHDRMRRQGALQVRAFDFPAFPHCRFVGAK